MQTSTPTRPWHVIARELANEHEQNRITQLSEELSRALEEQGPGSPIPTVNGSGSAENRNPAGEEAAQGRSDETRIRPGN
jgi:hypothetical protein